MIYLELLHDTFTKFASKKFLTEFAPKIDLAAWTKKTNNNYQRNY
jgi:hypothetical protein